MAVRRSVPSKSIALGGFHHRLALVGTGVGLSSGILSFIRPPSYVPSLHGRYPLRCYYERSDSVPGGSSAHGLEHERRSPSAVSLLTASDFPTIPSPTICGVLAGRGGSFHAAPPMPEGLALRDRLRLSYAGSPTDADRIEFTLPPFQAVVVTDWSFSFRCSPPRVATTQLRFNTSRLFVAWKRTLIALIGRPHRRT